MSGLPAVVVPLVLALQDAAPVEPAVDASWFERGVSLLGLLVMIGIAYAISVNRRAIAWRPVVTGVALQVVFALLILKTAPGRMVFDKAKDAFTQILKFSEDGCKFVFGALGDEQAMNQVLAPNPGFIFAFQIAATIIFVSCVMAMLYHVGIMQRIVYVMALVMQKVMRVSGAESLAAAANVFVGQTEAPLTVRPYLGGMTGSELTALMTGGMATVAGGVLAAYVGFGIDAGHLLAASVMSAPAALVIAKIIVPETGHSQTAGDVPLLIEKVDTNLLDAACRGAGEGLKLSLNVMAMLIAFIALVAMVNFLLDLVVEDLTLQAILSYIFCPLAWVIGVDWVDALAVGRLLGEKIVLNEFIAFISLAGIQEEIAPRSTMIATYALCGFANFSSIAIQIGGIGALEPSIRTRLAKYGLRSMVGGTLAAMMTATIAGVLISQ